eukprot:g17897.t1
MSARVNQSQDSSPVPETFAQNPFYGHLPPETLVQKIARSVASLPEDRVFARWYDDKGQVESTHTFHAIWEGSGEVAHVLRVERGLSKGDRVVLAFKFGLEFFVVFLGCLRAGIVAVPVYPPNPANLKKSLPKFQLIVDSCEPKLIVVDSSVNRLRLACKIRALAKGSNSSGWPDLPYHCSDVEEEVPATTTSFFAGWLSGGSFPAVHKKRKSFDEPHIKPEDVAFLQFTSGSTSDPKGVMVTFSNLEHNTGCIIRCAEMEIEPPPQGGRVWFSWLPTFHDMGLIQGTLAPFMAGWRAAYCSPATFVRNPLIWLQLMSRERSQMTAAPDFAYRLCARRWNEMTPEAQAALKLDLRHLGHFQNAAEPVRASTVRAFVKAFAPVGLSVSAPCASYGLAEHTVACALRVTNKDGQDLDSLSDEQLQACGNTRYAVTFGHHKIVDPETLREVRPGETGELWVDSPSVASGYWGKPELTRETFQARINCDRAGRSPDSASNAGEKRYLRTGDLCRIDTDGFLFVEGRLKDLIIVNGRNIYPQDVEFAVDDASSHVRPGCIAAFSETELGGGLEIVMEVRDAAKKMPGAIATAIESARRRVMEDCGLYPTRVVAIKERTIPKTTSGKIQRRLTRTLLHHGDLEVVAELSHDASRRETPLPPPSPTPRPPQQQQQQQQQRRQQQHQRKAAKAFVASAPAPRSDDVLAADPPPHEESKGEPVAPLCAPGRPSDGTTQGGEGPTDRVLEQKAPAGGREDSPCGDIKNQGCGVALRTEDVVRIVETATGLEDLGASDDLLDLGVDSLMSVAISADLSEASGFQVPEEIVFRYPTASLITGFVGDLRKRNKEFLVDSGDLEKERLPNCTAAASFRFDQSGKTARLDHSGKTTHLHQFAQTTTGSARFAGRSRTATPSPGCDKWDSGAKSSRLSSGDEAWTTGPMKGWIFRVSQVLLLILVVAQIFIAAQPARHYWRFLDDLASTSFWGYSKEPWLFIELPVFGKGAEGSPSTTVSPFGFLRVLSPSIWFACYTAIVIVTKWLLVVLRVSTPRELRVPLSTVAYLSWWYLNVLLNVWEATGGRWLLDTRMLILFYRMLGAKVAWNAKIRVFLRDFDSLEIHAGATIGGQLYVRRFEASHMAVLPIVVGKGADISTGSVVYGGTKVGQNCVVEPLTVVPPSSYLAPNSTWEGHPAKETKGSTDSAERQACGCKDLPIPRDPCSCNFGAFLLELAKQTSIAGTLLALESMTHIPLILYASMGLPESFRYALLVRLALLFAGVSIQFAIFTVLLKWVLAGRVTEGVYRPNVFRVWRRWYLGRLQALVDAYFLVFNQGPRYYWWGKALGMHVERGSTVFLRATNPMDADLIKIGGGAHVAFPTLSVDRSTGCGPDRERKPLWIGSKALVGFGSHLSGSVGASSRLGGYSLVRPGEYLVEGSITMCDLQSAYKTGDFRSTLRQVDSQGISHTYHGPREAVLVNFLDAACTLGLWTLNTLSVVVSFEATKTVASLTPYNDGFGSRYVALSTVALVAWALSTSVLLSVFKRIFACDFDRSPTAGVTQTKPESDNGDIEKELSGAQQQVEQRRAAKLTASQCMQWRWMWRALFGSLFEPYVVNIFLKGTWLFNVWLKLMGADVSMGALIVGKVSDHGLVKVCEGAVVDGILYGHRGIYIDGLLSMEMAPVTIGERAVLHAHTATWCVDMRAGSTITSASATLPGTVFEAGEVYGGRPPRKLASGFVA